MKYSKKLHNFRYPILLCMSSLLSCPDIDISQLRYNNIINLTLSRVQERAAAKYRSKSIDHYPHDSWFLVRLTLLYYFVYTYDIFSFRTHVRLLVLKFEFICHQPFFSQVKSKSNSLLPQKPILRRRYVLKRRDLLGRFLLLESVFQLLQATMHKFIYIHKCIYKFIRCMHFILCTCMYRILYSEVAYNKWLDNIPFSIFLQAVVLKLCYLLTDDPQK